MSLTLYRRHSANCEVRKRRLSPRAKRLYMACNCPIWIYGRTTKGLVPRQSARTDNLAEAEAVRGSLLADSKTQAVHGLKLADCIEKYISSREHEIGEKTQGQIRLLLTRLQTYCHSLGAYFIQEIDVDMLETFVVTPALSGSGLRDIDTGQNPLRLSAIIQSGGCLLDSASFSAVEGAKYSSSSSSCLEPVRPNSCSSNARAAL
jgi:hypothetical protein